MSAQNRGQALVETLLVIPLFLLILQGLFFIGELGRAKIVIEIAAREGARAASVGLAAEPVVRQVCQANFSCSSEDLQVRITGGFAAVTVEVAYQYPAPLPFDTGNLLVVSTQATMPKPLWSF